MGAEMLWIIIQSPPNRCISLMHHLMDCIAWIFPCSLAFPKRRSSDQAMPGGAGDGARRRMSMLESLDEGQLEAALDGLANKHSEEKIIARCVGRQGGGRGGHACIAAGSSMLWCHYGLTPGASETEIADSARDAYHRHGPHHRLAEAEKRIMLHMDAKLAQSDRAHM
jgi:hypothetical protein